MHPKETHVTSVTAPLFVIWYYCVINKQFDIELFCGITPLLARPTAEALRGIY